MPTPASLPIGLDVDHHIVRIQLDRHGHPFLEHREFAPCQGVHLKPFKPLRSGDVDFSPEGTFLYAMIFPSKLYTSTRLMTPDE